MNDHNNNKKNNINTTHNSKQPFSNNPFALLHNNDYSTPLPRTQTLLQDDISLRLNDVIQREDELKLKVDDLQKRELELERIELNNKKIELDGLMTKVKNEQFLCTTVRDYLQYNLVPFTTCINCGLCNDTNSQTKLKNTSLKNDPNVTTPLQPSSTASPLSLSDDDDDMLQYRLLSIEAQGVIYQQQLKKLKSIAKQIKKEKHTMNVDFEKRENTLNLYEEQLKQREAAIFQRENVLKNFQNHIGKYGGSKTMGKGDNDEDENEAWSPLLATATRSSPQPLTPEPISTKPIPAGPNSHNTPILFHQQSDCDEMEVWYGAKYLIKKMPSLLLLERAKKMIFSVPKSTSTGFYQKIIIRMKGIGGRVDKVGNDHEGKVKGNFNSTYNEANSDDSKTNPNVSNKRSFLVWIPNNQKHLSALAREKISHIGQNLWDPNSDSSMFIALHSLFESGSIPPLSRDVKVYIKATRGETFFQQNLTKMNNSHRKRNGKKVNISPSILDSSDSDDNDNDDDGVGDTDGLVRSHVDEDLLTTIGKVKKNNKESEKPTFLDLFDGKWFQVHGPGTFKPAFEYPQVFSLLSFWDGSTASQSDSNSYNTSGNGTKKQNNNTNSSIYNPNEQCSCMGSSGCMSLNEDDDSDDENSYNNNQRKKSTAMLKGTKKSLIGLKSVPTPSTSDSSSDDDDDVIWNGGIVGGKSTTHRLSAHHNNDKTKKCRYQTISHQMFSLAHETAFIKKSQVSGVRLELKWKRPDDDDYYDLE